MECPVCFEECSCTKLVCGHSICRGCIKNWSLKGCNDGCPMCRKPMYFRGCRELKKRWEEENLETKYTATFGSILDNLFLDFFEDEDMMEFYSHVLTWDMIEIEQTFNALKDLGYDPEDIEYLICEEGVCSGKKQKEVWNDEPVKEAWFQWRPNHFVV
jgi:hypothetical protein